jgi:hypothetical protein
LWRQAWRSHRPPPRCTESENEADGDLFVFMPTVADNDKGLGQRPEDVDVQAFVADPRQELAEPVEETIDSLDPLSGRTYPDRAWHPIDGRITELGMHLTVDPAVRHEVVVGTGVTSSRSEIYKCLSAIRFQWRWMTLGGMRSNRFAHLLRTETQKGPAVSTGQAF